MYATEDTHSQRSPVQTSSANGYVPATTDHNVPRDVSTLGALGVSDNDIPDSAFESTRQAPKRDRSTGTLSQSSRVNSRSSMHSINGQSTLKANTVGSSSIGSITGLLNNIRSIGQGSASHKSTTSQLKEPVGGGQKQYPLSQRFYKMERRIGEGASATVRCFSRPLMRFQYEMSPARFSSGVVYGIVMRMAVSNVVYVL